VERTSPDYRILLSRLVDGRQWDRALATAREWLAADPENPDANLVAGQALINLKRHVVPGKTAQKVTARCLRDT
jgi:uncharacterized protein (DUF736 family)